MIARNRGLENVREVLRGASGPTCAKRGVETTGASRHGTDASSARGNNAERPFIGYSGATATRAPRSGGSPTRSRCLSRLDMPLPKIGLVPVLEDAAMVRMPRVRRDATVERARKCTDGVEVNATANAMVAGRARAEKFELFPCSFTDLKTIC